MINLKLNSKGDDSASDVYRLLIAFVLATAVLVIIINMVTSVQKQSIIISNQKLKEGVQSAVKSAGTSAKIPFVIEDLMLSGNLSKTTIKNYSGLSEECMAFVHGAGLEPIDEDNNVLRIKGKYIEMDVWAYCNIDSSQIPNNLNSKYNDAVMQIENDEGVCPIYCVFFFNKKPDPLIYDSNPNTQEGYS